MSGNFAGTGTVGVVARRLGLDFVGCELSPHYAAIARKRIETALQSERLPAMSAEYEEAGLYLFHED